MEVKKDDHPGEVNIQKRIDSKVRDPLWAPPLPQMNGFIKAHLQIALVLKRAANLKGNSVPPTAVRRSERMECRTEEQV